MSSAFGERYWLAMIGVVVRPVSSLRCGLASPDAEYRYWYQWYFHTERAGLSVNRRPFCRTLWELGSPNRLDEVERIRI